MHTNARRFPFLNRRRFLQHTALLGASVAGLAACGGPADSNSVVTATVNTLPPDSNPGAVRLFNNTVRAFERDNPGNRIVGNNNPYDPATFFARVSAGQAEDATQSYFTEPPLLIKRNAVADITELAQKWPHFASYNEGIASIVTDPASNKIYGIPVTGYTLTLWYNRKLFSEAGLDPDKPPTTWEELRDYAKQLTSSSVAGFAETSTQNQGGWHFTNWMYSAGGDMQSADGTQALFNSEQGVSILQLLKDMRFTDQSLTKQQLFTQNDTLQLLATGKVAMTIMAPDQLSTLKTQFQANLEDFGIGPMPQNGGNAALTGGNVFVFNPKSSAEVIKTAFDYVLYSNFDLTILEDQLANAASAGQVVGGPTNILFTGEFQNQLNELSQKYANVPLENYRAFAESSLTLRPEPRTQTQQMYALLDPAVQAVLTDEKADPQKLLDEAAQQFQQLLDQEAS